MEFLEIDEIKESKDAIICAYELLLEKIPGIRRNSKQWRFFDLCFKRTVLGDKSHPEYLQANANYYKFEVQNILERYYNAGFQQIDYVFTLKHRKDINRYGFKLEEGGYPSTFDYFLLIRTFKPEDQPSISLIATKEYLQKIVYEGLEAEFNAYKRLPEIDSAPLLEWFHEEGSAYKEIYSTLLRLKEKSWVINNPFNPSHHLVKSLRLVEFEPDYALVKTIEYNYLKWFSITENDYRYIYRETNDQSYQLTKRDGKWLVEATLRRLPLTSLPRRYAEYKKK